MGEFWASPSPNPGSNPQAELPSTRDDWPQYTKGVVTVWYIFHAGPFPSMSVSVQAPPRTQAPSLQIPHRTSHAGSASNGMRYPEVWTESTTTPLAFTRTASSASNPTWTLSDIITPSAPPVGFPTSTTFVQTS